jgi:hypothetical protein
VESQLLPISPCTTQLDSASADDLIREWLFRFGVNFEKDVVPVLPLWLETFREMDPKTLESLFRKALMTCKFFPRVADILEPINNTKLSLASADLKWQQVLDYCRVYVSRDMPGGVARGAPRISPRTMTGIRAAGGLFYIQDCSLESLQWAKKRFIESYIAWETLKRDEFLLPDGRLKDLITGAAEEEALPERT